MAGSHSLPPLSNMDIIKITRGIGQDDYYRLGRVLGFDENILDHLWEPGNKGCALQVLLLWRDGLAAGDDQRAILAEKLSEAGLDDKRECLLSGFPASPGPYTPSPVHSITSMPSPISPKENNPTTRLEPSVLSPKQTKGSYTEPQPSAAAGRNNEEVGAVLHKPEQSVKAFSLDGNQGTGAAVQGLTGSDNEEDSDGSDSEEYINVSKKTLREGSVSVSVIHSKPRFSFHGSQDNCISTQRKSLVMESKPLLSPPKLDDTSTQEQAEQHVCGNAKMMGQNSLSSSGSTSDSKEPLKSPQTQSERPLKPPRKGIAPLVIHSPASVGDNDNPDHTPYPPCQPEAPTELGKDKPGGATIAVESRYHQQSPPPVSPRTSLTLLKGNKVQLEDKEPDVTSKPSNSLVHQKPIKPVSFEDAEEGSKEQQLVSPRSLPRKNTMPYQKQDNTTVLPEYKPTASPCGSTLPKENLEESSPRPNGPERALCSQDLTDQGKMPESNEDSHQRQLPSIPASSTQNKSRTKTTWVRQDHTYASIGEESTMQRSQSQTQDGPSVAPYKPQAQAGFRVSSDLQDSSRVLTGLQPSLDVNNRQQKTPATLSETAVGRGSHKPQPPPPPPPEGTPFQIKQGISEDVLRALAADIATEGEFRALGLELGFQEAEINGFEAMNQRADQLSKQGTLEMLLKWGSNVSSEDQALLLKHALRRSGLVNMAETHLKAPKRRRDIRNVKIAKYFTVSDCREKLECHYRINNCTSYRGTTYLNSGSQNPVLVTHRLVKRGKTLYVEKVPLEGSINGILKARKDGALPMRIVVFAPPGLGKSTMVAQMAHDWAERVPGSPLQDVSLLFVLKMKFISNHGSLGQAIVNQLLSDVRGLNPQAIDQFIEDNQSECMVVLDGLDEFKGEISSIKCGHVLRVVQNIQLRKCRVVVTSLPRLEDFFEKEDLPMEFLKMELQGFSQLQSTSFIRSFFRENHLHKADELLVFLRMNVVINELLAAPLFCLLVCHLWESNLLQLVTTESEFYDSVNRFFLRHGEEKASVAAGDTDLEVIVQGLGEFILHGMLEDPYKRAFGHGDFKKIPAIAEKAIALGIICKGSSKKRDDSNMEFYHRNAQEHCVAKYLSREVAATKSTKGKATRLDKALKQMTKTNLVDFGRVLRFTAGLGSYATGLHVIEAIQAAENLQIGDKSRMILDCLAEIPHLDTSTSYVVERCFAGGNIILNLPTIHTTLGFYKLPAHVKEKVRSVTIHSSFMPPHVAKSLSMGLQACPDLLKLEVADAQNPTYPVILLLANKLSVHLYPEGALSVLPDLSQMVFNKLRLVNLSGCHISSEATRVLWATLARCPHIDVMTVKNSAITGRDLPRLSSIAVLQANLKSPVQAGEVNWLSSILGDAEYSPEVRLTIGDPGDGTIRRVGVGIQEHVLMAEERVDLTNATGNTIKILNVLPDSFRRKVRTLCINRTRFTDDLTRPLLDTVHSLIRLETFTTENCNIPDELKQLQVFKGSFQRQVNELPTLESDGVLRGSVSSPLREEEFERLSSALTGTGTTTLQEVHLVIEHHRRSETDFQELVDITGDNMELCNVSSATIEIIKMLPASFRQQMHSARIRNCNLTDELSQLLSETLQSIDELELFLSENSTLNQKAIHLTNVMVLDLGRFASTCFDWEWLENATMLEELHLTFASSSSLSATPSSPTSLSVPTTPTTPKSPTFPKGAGALLPDSGSIYQDILTEEETFQEDFHLQLAHGKLVISRMSSCSLSVMLHLPAKLKKELRHLRIRSTKLTVDVLNQLADVLKSFEHLGPLSLQNLYRRPIKHGCILHPGAMQPVVGQWD